jgi:hypothetical protein
MTFKEAERRGREAGLYAHKFMWDREKSVEIFGGDGDIGECLSENPGSRAMAGIGMGADGKTSLWVCVVGTDGTVLYEENTAFPCPPFPDCP